MLCQMLKITIGAEKRQFITNTKLRKQRVGIISISRKLGCGVSLVQRVLAEAR